MMDSRKGLSWIPEICLQLGLRRAVISPGSRNAPLIMALVNYPGFNCFSITDERSAGFVALGMAQQLNLPVALICTSGTAVLNYAPAIAEAYYQKIPLLVITADRPPELIDQNEGQSIRQRDIFANYIKKSFELPVDTAKLIDQWYCGRIISEAVNYTMLDSPGPVHLNVPLREPLYTPIIPADNPAPIINVIENKRILDEIQWQGIATEWKKHKKKLVLCGFHKKDTVLNEALEIMAKNNEVVVMAENLSNLSSNWFIDSPECFLAGMDKNQKKEFSPDLVITIGGAIISKLLKNYLREYKCKEHWNIDENDLFIDTFGVLKKNIRLEPAIFFKKVRGEGNSNVQFSELAGKINNERMKLHSGFFKSAAFSDIMVVNKIFETLPENINLQLGNSNPVRYSQLFKTKPYVVYNSNRGTSGIDGCVSTAAGAAMVNNRPTVLITGDLAFIYDSNGMWNSMLPDNLRIIVINNNEGNIFKLIETSREVENIKNFLETPHKVNIEALATAYGLNYYFANDDKSLDKALSHFFEQKSKASVLEVKTSGEISARMFKLYYKLISKQNEQ